MNAEHPSELELHRLLAQGGRGELEARLAPHVSQCQRCQAVLAQLAQAEQHFEGVVFAKTTPALLGRRDATGRGRIWWLVAPAALAAAGIALFVSSGSDTRDGTRSKGAGEVQTRAGLEIYARRGEQLFPLADGQTVATGDGLRFAVLRPPGMKYALVVSLTADGRTEVYYPAGADAAAELAGLARRVELAGVVAVDGRPGPERVMLFLDEHPFTLASALQAASERRVAGGPVMVTMHLQRAGPSPAR
jgi:hypothetical protein